jgi:DNA mismatch repair protein MSH4
MDSRSYTTEHSDAPTPGTDASKRKPPTSKASTKSTTGRASKTRKTGTSTFDGQQIVCGVIESRGVSPTVGLAALNLDTCEAMLCQISDNQSYVRTLQKLRVSEPSVVLVPAYGNNSSSTLHRSIAEALGEEVPLEEVEHRFFSEAAGLDYIKQYSLAEDVAAMKHSASGNFYAVCCFAAVRRVLIGSAMTDMAR